MKALRKLRKASDRATGAGGPGLTAWEKEFVDSVTGRLKTYGSAFRDPGKGRLEEALSHRQAHVTRVIEKKSRKAPANATQSKANTGDGPKKSAGLRRSAFKRKTPMGRQAQPRVRDVNEDVPDGPDTALTPEQNRAALRLVPGGKPGTKRR